MPFTLRRPALRALALAGGTLAVATNAFAATGVSDTDQARTPPHEQRLVVRGEATAVDAPCSADGICAVELTAGAFRGAPVGAGTYTGSLKLDVGHTFDNGEGGICAPLRGRLVLGAGSPDRLALVVSGDSCQDGAGPPDSGSFTGLARFSVVRATGSYAGVTGSGLASFSEDAAKHHRTTLIGRLGR